MLREKDLPRSDRGAALVERTVETQELSASPPIDEPIQLAECLECVGGYFPEQSFDELCTRPGEKQIEGEADSL